MGTEFCSITWNGWVRGSWFLEHSPAAKQGTQRSYSWQARCAHEILTWAGSQYQSVLELLGQNGCSFTVEVMSLEQTSQWYLVPPSVPRAAVFFRITPMDRPILSSSESGTEKPHQTRTGISHKAVLGGMVIDIDVATKKVVVRRARIEIDVITGRSSLERRFLHANPRKWWR